MDNPYKVELSQALSEFMDMFETDPDDAIYHLGRTVMQYGPGHPDHQRVMWCMMPVREFIDGEGLLHLDAAIEMTLNRLTVPPEHFAKVGSEMTLILFDNRKEKPE
jgi:hypothetical protein